MRIRNGITILFTLLVLRFTGLFLKKTKQNTRKLSYK